MPSSAPTSSTRPDFEAVLPLFRELVTKTMSLLLTPAEVFGDPAVLEKLARAATVERPVDPNRPPRPRLTRQDILAAGR